MFRKFQPKIYIKDESFDPLYSSINSEFYFRSRILPGVLMALGVLVLGTQVAMPLFFFKTQDEVAKPMESTVLGVASGFSEFEFKELGGQGERVALSTTPDYFYLTIPKLKIKDAKVETNSKSLNPDDVLGHYLGSSLPGEIGDSFIYGHSVLPWFFNPKNYKTIFSTLGDLSVGDEFYVKYQNKDLTYKVEKKEVLDPTKVEPLSEWKPNYLNEPTMTLMTCWPAGTKSKRMLVRAVQVEQ